MKIYPIMENELKTISMLSMLNTLATCFLSVTALGNPLFYCFIFGLLIVSGIEDAEGVAIYCDPPYLEKGATYVHDFKEGQHERLAGLLQRFKRTRVVVSYYDDARLKELYEGWRRREIEVTRSLMNQGLRDQGGGETVREVLLVNDRQAVSAGTCCWTVKDQWRQKCGRRK